MIGLDQTMGKAQFQLSYDGPGLRSGAMDVNELAPALLATADLFREANQRLNGQKTSVSIKVRSDFKRGSFEVFLLFDQNIIEQAKNVLFPTSVVGAAALVKFLFGTDVAKKGAVDAVNSVLDVWKKAKGEKPQSIIEYPEKKTSVVVVGNVNQINVCPEVAKLYNDEAIRSAVRATVRPVERQGVTSLRIKKGEKAINEVRKSDLPPVDPQGPIASGSDFRTLESTKEAVLRVTRANFEDGKWGFSDGPAHFSAEIADEDFKQQLDAHEIGFYKGDVVRVRLRVTQTIMPDGQFTTRYVIEEVIQLIHAAQQQPLVMHVAQSPGLPSQKPPELLGTSEEESSQ